jgi:hypothetical protein
MLEFCIGPAIETSRRIHTERIDMVGIINYLFKALDGEAHTLATFVVFGACTHRQDRLLFSSTPRIPVSLHNHLPDSP